MIHGTYVGSDNCLKGQTALLREDPVTCDGGNFGLILAQFDGIYMPEANGFPVMTEGFDAEYNPLAFGWHVFEREEFYW